jgi:hypothetical protein
MTQYKSLFIDSIQELFDVDKKLFFILLTASFILIKFLLNDVILNSIPNHEELTNDGSLFIFQIFNTLHYLWTPFALLWKFTVISFVIWVMSFIFGYKVGFIQLWQIVLVSEVVFLFPEIIKLFRFIVFLPNHTTSEIQNYYPLSTLSFFNTENLPKKFHYPLKTFNLFEIIYGLLLTFGFQMISKRSFKNSLNVIVFGYGLFLLLWLIFYVLSYR